MFKSIIISIFIMLSFGLSAQDIEWMTMNEALEQQDKKPKKIMLFVYAEWCHNCHKMNEKTFVNTDVAKYVNDNFYAVNFNGEGTEKVNYKGFEYTNPNYDPNRKGRNYQHFFADALQVTAYPTIVFFDENGEIISPVMGYKSAEDLEIYLKMVATDDYKSVTTAKAWQDYQQNFKPEFKVN
ncbi:thioredoxin family protein [Flavobacteriaceae bacterium 14752]|uniref:thioredoxin family protein n=1 Tax=Mesohalobacter salilacus TaxID=2491711 RepID=UPI000F63137E|nr:thioredoxin family protein [Flavobacteriaceae bacterium 14752]